VTRSLSKLLTGFVLPPLLGVAAPVLAGPAPTVGGLEALVESSSDYGIRNFYKQRGFRPLWLKDGRVGPDAARLLAVLRAAAGDAGRVGERRIAALEQAVADARSADAGALARAELMLSDAWVAHVQAANRPADVGMTYIDASLSPGAQFPAAILTAAAAAPSLADHLDSVSRSNPLQDDLRAGLAEWRDRWADLPRVAVPAGAPLTLGAGGPHVEALRTRLGLPAGDSFDRETADAVLAFKRAHGLPATALVDVATIDMLGRDPAQIEARLKLNLDRARALPRGREGKYVVVDAASAILFLYEDGRVADSMKVVVGKVTEQTPMAAGLIRSMVLNPYWNVPPDLVRKSIAPKVLRHGLDYLRSARFELLSDWTDEAQVVDPKTVDWAAVAAGRDSVRVRQLPGAGNAMGAMKFLFPNSFGVYLHDTPDKALFAQSERALSSGCVRLEDAPRLARWLFGSAPSASSAEAEQVVPLPTPVPVYLTYLTAGRDGSTFALRTDVYGRDRPSPRVEAASLVGDDATNG
jgi:murein L,D-transpeptidase YcbB/YkuD